MKTFIGKRVEIGEIVGSHLARVIIKKREFVGKFRMKAKPGDAFFIRYVNKKNQFVLKRNKKFTKDAEDEDD